VSDLSSPSDRFEPGIAGYKYYATSMAIMFCGTHQTEWDEMESQGRNGTAADPPRLVLQTLEPLLETAPTRPCYRLIGGILVERTVKDVYPTLETNHSGIKEVLESLVKTYRGKDTEFEQFRKEHDIRVS
jgi:hypothetical protein